MITVTIGQNMMKKTVSVDESTTTLRHRHRRHDGQDLRSERRVRELLPDFRHEG